MNEDVKYTDDTCLAYGQSAFGYLGHLLTITADVMV